MPSWRKIRRVVRKILERTGLRRAPFFFRDNPDYAGVEAGEFSYGKPAVMGQDGSPETRVTIGHGAVVAGNPARVVKYPFEDEVIQRMLEIQWWDWPLPLIRQHASLLSTGRMADFLAVAEAVKTGSKKADAGPLDQSGSNQ